MKTLLAMAILLPGVALASPLTDAIARYRQTLREATPGATEAERADCRAAAVAGSASFSRQADIELACLQAKIAHHRRR